MGKKLTELQVEDLGPLLRRCWPLASKALPALLLLWMLAGLAMPMGGQKAACLAQLMGGEAPTTFWSWDPLLRLNESRRRAALIEASRQALKPGASLEQARQAAQDLAWSVAVFHGDRDLNELLLWAAYYQLPLQPDASRGPAGAGFRATALRCGMSDQSDGPLLAALASSGALDAVQGVRAFNTILSADPRDSFHRLAHSLEGVPVLRVVAWLINGFVGNEFRFWPPDNPAVLGPEAFVHITIRPNELARQIPDFLGHPGPLEEERSRLADLAVLKAWTDGVTEAAKVLDAAPGDPWLALVRARLGTAAAANGLEQGPITDNLHTALLQASPGTDPGMPDHGWNPQRGMGWYEQSWEGRYTLEHGVIFPRVDYQHSLKAWAAASRPLPAAAAIEPPTAPGGGLAPLSGVLALAANEMAAELPDPLWSSQAPFNTLDGLDAFRQGASWRPQQASELESRLAADGRVEGRIEPAKRGFRLALRLVRHGQAGPWVRKAFAAAQAPSAPGWMAAQALRMRGLATAAIDQRALGRPWFRTAQDLLGFAALLDGSQAVLGRADELRGLSDRNPGVWLQAFATGDLDPPARWSALGQALKAEPWHPRAQCRLAHYAIVNTGPKTGLNLYLEALKWAPADLEALRACAADLRETGFEGERQLLAEAAISATAQSVTALVLAAEMQEAWTWDWRAGNFGEASSPFGWSCYRLGCRRQLAFAEDAVKRDPSFGPGYLRLLKARQGLSETAAEMDGIVDAALKADPDESSCLEFRLFDLQPKWHGSESAMLAFARKYQGNAWDLVAHAHDQVAYLQDDATEYRGSPEVWKEVSRAFLDRVAARPWDQAAWDEFGLFAYRANLADETYAQLDRAWKAKPGPWGDRQRLWFLDGLGHGLGQDMDDQADRDENYVHRDAYLPPFYGHKKKLWDERVAVLKRLSRAWPLNNTWPNETAWLAWKLEDKEACAWAFHQAASQRDAGLWNEGDYAKARAWALAVK